MSVRANSIATKTEFVGARTVPTRGHHSNGQSGTIILLAGLMLLISTTPAYAEEKDANFFQQINLNGSLRAGYFGASRKLDGKEDLGTGSLWLKSSSNLGDNASFMAEGWLRNDETFREKNQTSLREGYFNITAGEADFRMGKRSSYGDVQMDLTPPTTSHLRITPCSHQRATTSVGARWPRK